MEKTQENEWISDGKLMSLFEHLAELRHRLIKSLLAIFVIFCACLFFSSEIINYLRHPLDAILPKGAHALHFTGPMDVFMAGIKVSFLSSLVLACPVWMYQFWKFIEPALYEKERKYILPFVISSALLFFMGVCFSFFVMIPIGMEYLIGLGSEVGTPIITVTDYLALVSVMLLGFGFVFELPLILILLAFLDLITADTLAKHRRIVIVLILIVAAILTPPDPVSQIGMAIPLYLMYELSIVIIRFFKPSMTKHSKLTNP